MVYVNIYILLLLLVASIILITGKNVPIDKISENFCATEKIDNTTSRTDVLTHKSNTPITFEIPYLDIGILCNSTGPPTSQFSLIFTQGATGDLSSPAVANFVDGFAESKRIICFLGRSNLELRTEMFRTVIEHHPCNVLGGRSMGSRASIAAAKKTDNLKALVLVSFPLKSDKGERRDDLLLDIKETIDVLFVIGSEDDKCNLDDLRSMIKRMKNKVWLVVVKNADHLLDMMPPNATRAVGKMIGKVVAEWIGERDETFTNREIFWDEDRNNVIVSSWNDRS